MINIVKFKSKKVMAAWLSTFDVAQGRQLQPWRKQHQKFNPALTSRLAAVDTSWVSRRPAAQKVFLPSQVAQSGSTSRLAQPTASRSRSTPSNTTESPFPPTIINVTSPATQLVHTKHPIPSNTMGRPSGSIGRPQLKEADLIRIQTLSRDARMGPSQIHKVTGYSVHQIKYALKKKTPTVGIRTGRPRKGDTPTKPAAAPGLAAGQGQGAMAEGGYELGQGQGHGDTVMTEGWVGTVPARVFVL